MHPNIALACLALTLLPTAGQEDSKPARTWWNSFPAANGDLALVLGEDGKSQSMLAVTNEYAALTGQHFLLSKEIRVLLDATRAGIQAPLVIPGEHVQPYFESMLIQNDFAMLLLREEAPRLLSIKSLRTMDRNTIRSHARFVPREHIGHMRDHPAMMVTTSVTLPYADVRLLSTAIRPLITDPHTQQILPAGNTDSMLITAFGPQASELASMLERINADARESWEREQARGELEGDSPGDATGDPSED